MLTALSLAACTQQLTPQRIDGLGRELSIQPVSAVTKAGPIDGTVFPNSYNMVVSAYYNAAEGESTNYFSGITFSRNASTGRWDEAKYWPMSGTLNLLAYSANDGTNNVVSAAPVYQTKNTDGVTLTVTDNRTAQVDILHSQVEEQTYSASGVPMQFKHAQAAIAFVAKSNVAYNASSNVGITITKITLNDAKYSGTLAISKTDDATDGYCVWSALGSEADKDLPGVGTGYNVPAAYLDVTAAGNHFGIGNTGIMVPEQAQTSFTIFYTLHNGKASDGTTNLDNALQYTHTLSGNWIEGKKYVYELNFTLNKIEVTPTVLDWNTDPGFDPNVPIPFKVNALKFSCPVEQTLKLKTQIEEADRPNLEYSYDGRVWNTAPFNTSIAFGNDQELYLRGSSGTFSQSQFEQINIEFDYNDTSHPVTCEGNIQHLLKYDEEYNQVNDYCFYALFQNQKCLVQAPELPATTLAEFCYSGMFRGCTSLTSAPELPATTLADYCYRFMFANCTSLTSAPELPATTLADYCYTGMFRGCTSLTSAPELPATTLANDCYETMFTDCSNLNYIKAAFTTEPSSEFTMNWLDGVSPTGTFVKNAAATWNVSGVSGIPSGWTVETYTP